jgi:hypothetical protein
MFLSKVELQILVIKAFSYKELTDKETKKMLKALWKKYWWKGLDNFQERVVLSSYICHPDSKEKRDDYIRVALARLTSKT